MAKTYLGDGVSLQYDGHYFILTMKPRHEDEPVQTIWLRPEVVKAMNLEMKNMLLGETTQPAEVEAAIARTGPVC